MKALSLLFAATIASAIVAPIEASAEDRKMVQSTTPAAIQPAIEGEFPSLSGATGWLNSPPLTAAGLRGKVVVLDVWTYTCINWLRTLPYVRAWAAKYKPQGLVVIGVHSPEFGFEKSVDNIRRAAKGENRLMTCTTTSPFAEPRLRGSMALLALVLLSACGVLPTQVDRPISAARQPSADSPLVRIAQNSSPEPTLTGFRLLPDGFYSLDARIQLVRRARDSLDVQYYLIQDDRTGRLLMRSLRDAALRGVRVRLLVDDLYTTGGDPMFQGLAAFPNVEVRLFNPFCCARQSTASKYIASLADFTRLNHRMHNKLFIADGVFAVMGGRNIADEYFTRSATSNFVDMDVFLVGPVVRQLTNIFDVYWNSPQAYPIATIVGGPVDRDEARRGFDHLVDDGEQMRSVVLPPFDILGYGPISDDLDGGRLGLVWGTANAFADQPGKVMAASAEAARSMSAEMNVMDRVMEAKSDVVISAPYFIPGPVGMQEFENLRKRKVKVTILTNSLAANDVPLVHTGYARYRVELLRNGVDIYELSPTRAQHNERLMLPGASLGRLHAKTAVIDTSAVYIGSVNLDPRSDSTNTELGLFARCPELAKEVIRVINISKLQSSYRLRFAPDGQRLEWLATDDQGEVVLSEEPEVTPMLRLKLMLLAPFVPEQLL